MPSYICKNKACSLCQKIMTEHTSRITVIGDNVIDSAITCPVCGNKREPYKDDGFTTQIHGSKNIPL